MLLRTLKKDRKGHIHIEEINFLGGKYSFLERLKKKGIGSPKVIYQSGIPAFDQDNRGLESEIAFVNFELFKEGLVVRMNRNNRTQTMGLLLSQIKYIQLSTEAGLQLDPNIVGPEAKLELIDQDGYSYFFSVLAQEFYGIYAYFNRSDFEGQFQYLEED